MTVEWPGNVRQLYHAVESAVLRASAEAALKIEIRHLFPDQAPPAQVALTYQDATRHFQRRFVKETLDEVDWSVSEAARRLDLGRTYLYRLIASLGITRGTD